MALLDADMERRMTKLDRTNKILRVAAVALRCVAMLFAIFLFLPYLKESLESPIVAFFWGLDYHIAVFIKGHVNTVFGGLDVSRWAPLILSFIGSLRVDDWADRNQIKLRDFRIKDHYAQWLTAQGIAADAPILKPLQKQIENLKISPSDDREELLKVFADAKRRLDAMGRDLAFLAADVADSTGMKLGEDAGTVMHAFREYRHFVEGCFQKHGVLKADRKSVV